MITAPEALARLREGNRRFIGDSLSTDRLASTTRRRAVMDAQNPFAVILGCSDSRVPAEMIFDQGLGDLFVIRVAGNIVAPSQIGSVEFAAERYGVSLVVVLGHSNCGAILATVEELSRGSKEQSPNLRHIVDRIRPSVQAFQGTEIEKDHTRLVHYSVRQNVRMSANQLRHGSDILEHLIERKGLIVVGAEYSLETGEVEFFDGVPDGT
jgi:carbonic anhydrase